MRITIMVSCEIFGAVNRTLLGEFKQAIPFDLGGFLLNGWFNGDAQRSVYRNLDTFIRLDHASVKMTCELNHMEWFPE